MIPTWIAVVGVIMAALSPLLVLGGVALGSYMVRKSDRELNTWRHRVMSTPSRLLGLDLASYSFAPLNETIALTANASGHVHGVVFWFDVELVPGIRLSNTPCTGTSHWMQAFACFGQPIAVAKGDEVVVQLGFSSSSVDISCTGVRRAGGAVPRTS